MRLKKAVLFFLMVIPYMAFLNGFGQDHYQVFSKSAFNFRYDALSGDPVKNYFITEITRINYLNLHKTAYTIDYEQTVNINVSEEKTFEMDSRVRIRNMRGDIYFKKYDLSDVLMPSVYRFDLSVFDSQNQLIEVIPFEMMPVVAEDTYHKRSFTLHTENARAFKITGFEFDYSGPDVYVFNERIRSINELLAWLDVTGGALKKAGSINPDEQVNVLGEYLKIRDIERTYLMAGRFSMLDEIGSPPEDSAFFISNLRQLGIEIRRLKTIFDQNTDTLVRHVTEQEFQFAAIMFAGLQLDYLDALNRSNYWFQPVYYRLAYMFSDTAYWSELKNNITEYFTRHIEIPEQVDPGNIFGRYLLGTYLVYAERFINDEAFNEAVLMLESANAICLSLPEAACDGDIFRHLSAAKYGIYNSFIRIGSRAASNRSLDLAKNYYDMALSFQKENNNFITSSESVLIEYERLAWDFFDRGKTSLKEGNPDAAMEDFNVAADMYHVLDIENEPDTHTEIGKALRMKFNFILDEAQENMEKSNYTDADLLIGQLFELVDNHQDVDFNKESMYNLVQSLNKERFENFRNELKTAFREKSFARAAAMLGSFNEKYPAYRSEIDTFAIALYKQYLRPELTGMISKAESLAAEGRQQDANVVAEEILILLQDFSQFRDEGVGLSVDHLISVLEPEQCGRVRKEIDQKTTKAIAASEVNDFSAASSLLGEIANLYEANSTCKFIDTTFMSLIRRYGDVFHYKQLLSTTEKYYSEQRYDSAVTTHLKAENIFYEKEVYRFGETYIPVNDFIASKSNAGLNQAAIEYYFRGRDYRNMLGVMHLTLAMGFPLTGFNQELSVAGEHFAAYYKARYPQNDPEVIIREFTGAKVEFNPFRDSFINSWSVKKKSIFSLIIK